MMGGSTKKGNSMNVRVLGAQDIEGLEDYLASHRDESMFIVSNLRAAGLDYRGNPFEGEYFGYTDDESDSREELRGVIVHYWNGNILMHARHLTALEPLTAYLKARRTRPISGILGPTPQAEHVITHLGLSSAPFRVNRSERLYKLELNDLKEWPISRSMTVVPAQEIPERLLEQWLTSYACETLGMRESTEDKESPENKRRGIKDLWVLLLDGKAVALSGYNARLEDSVQVGPVWTPPELRNQGFSRCLLSHILAQEKQRGIRSAILFTGHPAAQRVYRALGFKHIGGYHLALLPEHRIRPFCSEDCGPIAKAFAEAGLQKAQALFDEYMQQADKGELCVWIAHTDGHISGYVTLTWNSRYVPFREKNIPEIKDLNVLPSFRKMGIGSLLLETAEKRAALTHKEVGLGVSLYGGNDGGYGAAQRLYVKRGYIPDGMGATYDDQPALPCKSYPLDDDLILWLVKRLS